MRNKNAILRTNANGEFFIDGMLWKKPQWSQAPLNFYYFVK